MPEFSLGYGTTTLPVHLPDDLQVDVIAAAEYPPAPDPLEAVRAGLRQPVGKVRLEDFSGARRVAIAINDKTRPVPHQYLLPPLLQRLIEVGIPREAVTLILATGTHLPMPPEEFARVVPAEILANYHVVSHNCDDFDNLIDLGVSSRGTPLAINRFFYEADLKIVVGNIEPHHFMGFSGGVKSACIGLGGRQTININHAMLVDPLAIIGEYDRNPMRMDIEEFGLKAGVHFALNAVLNGDRQIVRVFTGDPREVMKTGIPLVRQVSQTEVNGLYDVVMASAGGHPKDINFYQAQKCLTHAALVTRPGGVIILAAACPEGPGSQGYEQFMQGVTSVEAVFEKFAREGFRVGPHKAFQVARILQDKKIIMISHIPNDRVRSLLIQPAGSLDEAFAMACAESGCIHPRVGILPHATNTIAVIQSK